MATFRRKAITVGSIYTFDIAAIILFGVILGWI
jgi:hypothetical protein